MSNRWQSTLAMTLALSGGAHLARAQGIQWTTEEVTLPSTPGPLAGTLTIPKSVGRMPLAIIIVGSGGNDRNGNFGPVQAGEYRLLAEGLARSEIATLRYDKRGVAGSRSAATSEADMRFGNAVDDAAAWAKQYRSDPRFSSIIFIGHSEGSLIGMLAAPMVGADAYVSIAGPARAADAVLREQLVNGLPPIMLPGALLAIDSLKAGKTIADVNPALAALFRPSVQPYLISWFKYTPAIEIAKLKMPVLVAQGTTDVQVPESEADALAKALPSAKVVKVKEMNHVLKHATGNVAAQQAVYADPALPVVPELIDAIAAFIHESTRGKKHP